MDTQPTPQMAEDPLIREVVDRLVRALAPERIYLFGSRARNDATGDSDYDLLVVVPASELPGYKRDQVACRVVMDLDVAVEILVWTRAEFDRKRHLKASLPATLEREGRLVYAA